MTSSLLMFAMRGVALVSLMTAIVISPDKSYAEIISSVTIPSGDSPYSVAVNPDTDRIYVANKFSNNVTVIDGASASTMPPIPAGVFPYAIAVNRTTNRVYVANYSGNSVTVIDGATNSVITTVPTGSYPVAISVNPLTNKIYIANNGNDSVTVIDGETNSTTNVPVGYVPVAIAVNPATNKIYVANSGGIGEVTVIDANNSNSTASVRVGVNPVAIAVNPNTNKVYVANQGGSSVTVIDGISDTAGPAPISVGNAPRAIAVNAVTNKIYVANQSSGTISVINGTDNSVESTVPVGTTPTVIAVNSGTNKVYVANQVSNNVTVIDGSTNGTTTVNAPAGLAWTTPSDVVVNPETNKAYIANQGSDNVAVIQSFYSLSITKTGAGAGTVSSQPAGIACGAVCAGNFPEGLPVLLFQAPVINSGFNGWGGACSGTGGCAFNMLSDKAVTAEFVLSPLVKNKNTGVAYSSLQAAYAEASDADTIMARSALPAAKLNLGRTISLTIEGGYDADYDAYYSSSIDLTPVLGSFSISLAPLRVRGLAVRKPATP